MKVFQTLVAVSFLLIAGTTFAGEGGPIVSGYWEGNGQAIYPDGTSADITFVQAFLTQEGSFIYGDAGFMVIIGDNDPVEQGGQMSGHISGNKITGLLGGCLPEAPACVGAGVFEGKICGNKLSGTIMDMSDGSTSVVTLHRMVD